MKTLGIIAEYNPFHNGHEYHIREALAKSGADFVVVVMSGDFVQRGEPALIDKFARAEMALKCGADLVLELPVHYSCASAEFFASGAVAILDRLGAVDVLSFGSESADIDRLSRIASFLAAESDDYRDALRKYLGLGMNFPKARSLALTECLGEGHEITCANDILAVEYLKALKKQGSSMDVLAIKRLGDYHGREDTEGKPPWSAQYIREQLLRAGTDAIADAGTISDAKTGTGAIAGAISETHAIGNVLTEANEISDLMPPAALKILSESPCFVTADDLSLPLIYALTDPQCRYEEYADVTQELAASIRNALEDYTCFSGFAASLASKNYTATRINRCLSHILLGIKQELMSRLIAAGYTDHACVIGFSKRAAAENALLSELKRRSSISLITNHSQSKSLSGCFAEMYEGNLRATRLYQRVVQNKIGLPYTDPLRRHITIIS